MDRPPRPRPRPRPPIRATATVDEKFIVLLGGFFCRDDCHLCLVKTEWFQSNGAIFYFCISHYGYSINSCNLFYWQIHHWAEVTEPCCCREQRAPSLWRCAGLSLLPPLITIAGCSTFDVTWNCQARLKEPGGLHIDCPLVGDTTWFLFLSLQRYFPGALTCLCLRFSFSFLRASQSALKSLGFPQILILKVDQGIFSFCQLWDWSIYI